MFSSFFNTPPSSFLNTLSREIAHVLAQKARVQEYDALVAELVALRERGGRLFCLGVGGGAANAAHAACDFRKLCGIEAYAPSNDIAELTARANDDGWAEIFAGWLPASHLSGNDALMVFSVGGGHTDVSACITNAVLLAKEKRVRIFGVVGRADGAAATYGDAVMIVGPDSPGLMTPVTEAAQLVVLHALVFDPRLRVNEPRW